MLLTLFDNPLALADPLAWMELFGYISPWTRRVLALLLLLPPSLAASALGVWASGGLAGLQSVVAGAAGGLAVPVLFVVASLARARRHQGRE